MKHLALISLLAAVALLPACQKSSSGGSGLLCYNSIGHRWKAGSNHPSNYPEMPRFLKKVLS
jgi:hypothetical protein